MRVRSAYDRALLDGFRQGQHEVADAAVHAATHARAVTTAGQLWLADLASRARRLGRTTAKTELPPEADLLRTPPGHVRALTSHLPPAQARQAAHRYGIADGRIAAVAATGRDLHQAAGQDLGGLCPAVDGRPAHLWLETAQARWLDIAARGEAPAPGTQAALAQLTLLSVTVTVPVDATPPLRRTASMSAQQAARPAPATPPPGGQAASIPAPAGGVARVTCPAPRR
jgi:hypothetical protein